MRRVMQFLMRPMLQGFAHRDCLHTDVFVQLTAARHVNHYKGVEIQGVKNPKRDRQMRGGQRWLLSPDEMGALLNYYNIIFA